MLFGGVAAGDGCAGFFDLFLQAGEHLAQYRGLELLRRKSDQAEGHDRPTAHGVDIRECVGRGDAAKVARVIHDGREKVHGLHEGSAVAEADDPGIVKGFRPVDHLGTRRQ